MPSLGEFFEDRKKAPLGAVWGVCLRFLKVPCYSFSLPSLAERRRCRAETLPGTSCESVDRSLSLEEDMTGHILTQGEDGQMDGWTDGWMDGWIDQ